MRTLTRPPACLPWPPGGPKSFGPGTCWSPPLPAVFSPHPVPWWSLSRITPASYGWVILAILLTALVLASVLDWAAGQYEFTCGGRWPHIARRWYGPRAWIAQRGHRHEDGHHRFQVIKYDTGGTDCPWLLVRDIDDEGAEVIWAPVTWFVPEAVRRLRPQIFRCRRMRRPALFAYQALPWPSPGRPSGWPEAGA